MRRHAPRLVAAAIAAALLGTTAGAFETDQYYAWTREVADSTDVLNAKFGLEIRRVLEQVNSRRDHQRRSCHELSERVRRRLRPFVFRNVGLWAANSPFVSRVPSR